MRLSSNAIICAIVLALSGCMDTSPASRATSASYGDINPRVVIEISGSTGVVVTASMPFTIGDGALASADSSGSTETQTATPTMDIRPDIDVSYNGPTKQAADTLSSLTSASVSALANYLKSGGTGKVTLTKSDGTTVTGECVDGSCTIDGVRISQADCSSCTDK